MIINIIDLIITYITLIITYRHFQLHFQIKLRHVDIK